MTFTDRLKSPNTARPLRYRVTNVITIGNITDRFYLSWLGHHFSKLTQVQSLLSRPEARNCPKPLIMAKTI